MIGGNAHFEFAMVTIAPSLELDGKLKLSIFLSRWGSWYLFLGSEGTAAVNNAEA